MKILIQEEEALLDNDDLYQIRESYKKAPSLGN